MATPVQASLTPTSRRMNWHAVKPPGGGSIRGVYCGKLMAFECHWVQESNKPCRAKITGGALECYCKSIPLSLRTIGYAPIETREKEQLAIIVPKTTALTVSTFAQGDSLEFMRAKREKSPVRCRCGLAEEVGSQHCLVVKQEKPRDIFPYLLHLWGDVALQRFFSVEESPATTVQANLLRLPRVPAKGKPAPTQRDENVTRILAGVGLDPNGR